MKVLFINTNLSFDVDSEFEIGEGHRLRRATQLEIDKIKEFGNRFGFLMSMDYQKYEYNIVRDGNTIMNVPLPEADWRYTVVEFSGDKPSRAVLAAMALPDIPVVDLFLINVAGESTSAFANPVKLFTTLTSTMPDQKIATFTEDNAAEIRRNVKLLNDFPEMEEFEFIAKGFADFDSLRLISPHTPFAIIAIYSIIELLLTHKPLSDIDSLTKQITNKMQLVNNRFEQPIDIAKHFDLDTTKPDTLLKKLYTYRSEIAHGTFSGFTGELQVLKNSKLVFEFLDRFLKRLLIQCLIDPRLIHDLRKC